MSRLLSSVSSVALGQLGSSLARLLSRDCIVLQMAGDKRIRSPFRAGRLRRNGSPFSRLCRLHYASVLTRAASSSSSSRPVALVPSWRRCGVSPCPVSAQTASSLRARSGSLICCLNAGGSESFWFSRVLRVRSQVCAWAVDCRVCLLECVSLDSGSSADGRSVSGETFLFTKIGHWGGRRRGRLRYSLRGHSLLTNLSIAPQI